MMSNQSFTKNMAIEILESEISDRRFEEFCVDLFRDVDGIEYVVTSESWDLGRDGRPTSSLSGRDTAIICCSRTDKVDSKAEHDILRAIENANPNQIRFCSCLSLTEHQRDKIVAHLRQIAPNVSTIMVDGAVQVAIEAARYACHFEEYYASEIDILRQMLLTNDGINEQFQIRGMQIALITQLEDDAKKLRDAVSRNLVLTALADGKGHTFTMLTKAVTEQLRLGRLVSQEYLMPTLQELLDAGRIVAEKCKQDVVYTLTASGSEDLRQLTQAGARRLLHGRRLFADLITELTGIQLDKKDFSLLWNTIQDEIANMFLENGIQIIEAIAAITGNGAHLSDFPAITERLTSLARKVRMLDLGGARADEISQAVVDVFHEKNSPAFEWLTELSTIYVIICSLGLEPAAQQQVQARLQETELLLDTDVLISYLADGEENHEVVQSIVKGWRRFGGSIYVTDEVLYEAAYHAWISEADYQDNWRLLGSMTDVDANHLIKNAFVRAFRVVGQGRYEPRRWGYYIDNYRGQREDDYRKILGHLQEEKIRHLSEAIVDKQFVEDATKVLMGMYASGTENEDENHAKREKDKLERDARLLAALEAHRRTRKDLNLTAVIISSSKRLPAACERFTSRLGEIASVLTIGAVAYLLSLVPGVSIGLGSLRKVLFDPGLREHLPGLETQAMRAILASEQYTLPFSRRYTLKHLMREKLSKTAKERGQKPQTLRQELATSRHGEQQEVFAELVADVIDQMEPSRAERDNILLRQKIRELEAELERNRTRDTK